MVAQLLSNDTPTIPLSQQQHRGDKTVVVPDLYFQILLCEFDIAVYGAPGNSMPTFLVEGGAGRVE